MIRPLKLIIIKESTQNLGSLWYLKHYITTCRGAWLFDGFGLDYWIDILYIRLVASNTALSLIYTLYKSLWHAKPFQSSLVVPWQRINKVLSLQHTIKSSLHSLIPFLLFLLNYSATANCGDLKFFVATVSSRDSHNSHTSRERSSLYSFGAPPTKKHCLRIDSLLQRCVYRTVA
jgi:hypothetical protein